MKKIITVLILLSFGMLVHSSDAFINFYNNKNNWVSKEVGNGTLIVNQKFTLNRDLVLPNNIEVKIVSGGEISTNHLLELTGDPNNPPNNDPKVLYDKKINAVMAIINNLLLD